ncbi:MAG: class I SAM-dependent methyltransferase [Caldithrix sp.]|nr:MAG: class I SAM-dependent methyltransferase [Caldithrix sp.]
MQKKTNSDTLTSSIRMELVEGYFDNNSQYWSEAYLQPQCINDFVLINRNKIAVDFLCSELKPTVAVLDAGCGAGMTTLALVEKGFFVQAMDISQKMLNLCQQNLANKGISPSNYVLSRANVIEADIPEKSFDGIAALGFLQYQADEHQALMTLNKLIKPGGILVISGPVKVKISNYFGLAKIYDAIKKWVRKSEPNKETAVLHQISTHYYGVARFRALLRDSGFQMLDYKGHGFVNFAVIGDWTSRGQHFLHRFFTRLSKFLPIHRFGNDMVVIARKSRES